MSLTEILASITDLLPAKYTESKQDELTIHLMVPAAAVRLRQMNWSTPAMNGKDSPGLCYEHPCSGRISQVILPLTIQLESFLQLFYAPTQSDLHGHHPQPRASFILLGEYLHLTCDSRILEPRQTMV